MQAALLVFVGSGIGGVLRHLVNVTCLRLCGPTFPWGTLTVNVVGGAVMGIIAGWLAFRAGEGWSQPLRLFLTTGIVGGFTTFSAFSLDAVLLWERGEAGLAAAYVIASVVLAIGAVGAGLALVRAVA